MKKYRININGSSYEVEVEEIGESKGVSSPSEKPAAKTQEKKVDISPSKLSGNAEGVSAPMPGTIVDIRVKEGDTVKSGQVIMVLEAMKMENEIVAPKDGKVCAIRAAKGSSVSSGEALLDIA